MFDVFQKKMMKKKLIFLYTPIRIPVMLFLRHFCVLENFQFRCLYPNFFFSLSQKSNTHTKASRETSKWPLTHRNTTEQIGRNRENPKGFFFPLFPVEYSNAANMYLFPQCFPDLESGINSWKTFYRGHKKKNLQVKSVSFLQMSYLYFRYF